MPAVCSACRAESPDNAAFCVACGRPLFTLPPPPNPPGMRLLGEISYAWSDFAPVGIGSVKIAVTDLQTLVIAASKPSLLPSLQAYHEWEATLTTGPHIRFSSSPWPPAPESILWAFDNDAIAEVRVRRLIGIGVPKGLSQIEMWVKLTGVRISHPLIPTRDWAHFLWRVPGKPEEILAFFAQLPFASAVVSK